MIVYVSAPYRGDGGGRSEIEYNTSITRGICRTLMGNDVTPLAPSLYLTTILSAFAPEERRVSEFHSLRLLRMVDAVVVDDSRILSGGMRDEVKEAFVLGIPVYRWKGPVHTFDDPCERKDFLGLDAP